MKLIELELYTLSGMMDIKNSYPINTVEPLIQLINPINILRVTPWDDTWSCVDMIGPEQQYRHVNIEIKELKSMIEEAMDDIRIEDLDKFSWRDYVITNGRKK